MPTYPTQRGLDLRDDILSLVKFWHVMHSDKKYMKSSDIVIPGLLTTSMDRARHTQEGSQVLAFLAILCNFT